MGRSFTVFVGNDLIAFEGLAVGADGWISCLPMIVPSRAVKLYRLLAVEKNLSAARELFYPLVPSDKTRISSCLIARQRPALACSDPGVGSFARNPGRTESKASFGISRAHADQLKELLVALGEIDSGTA